MVITAVMVTQPSNAVLVTQPTYTIVVSAAVSSVTTTQGTEIEKTGTDFSGADGASGRSYVHSAAISSNAKVYLGTTAGTSRLRKASWSLSTTNVANDTITINLPIYNTDTILIDS